MAKIVFHHHEHFELLDEKNVPEGHEGPEGYRTVETVDGPQERGRYRMPVQDNTTVVELPEYYDVNNLQAHVDLLKMIQDRHSDKIHLVTGEHPTAAKVAGFLGVEHRSEHELSQPAETPVEMSNV